MKKTALLLGLLLSASMLSGCIRQIPPSVPEGYKITFVCDEHVKVKVFETKEIKEDEYHWSSDVTIFSRDGETGEIIKDGTGQVNFQLVFDTDYEAAAQPVISGEEDVDWGSLKTPRDTGKADVYRVTKIAADITITITSKQSVNEHGYTVTFVCEHASVKVFPGQDYTVEPTAAATTETINPDTGKPTQDSEYAQVNFLIVVEAGYKVGKDQITIVGNYNKLKDQENNIWRITKIQENLTVTITPIAE